MKRRKPQPPRKTPPEAFFLMAKVKRQLEELQKPPWAHRSGIVESEITVSEYARMDRTLSIMQVDPRLHQPPNLEVRK